MPNPEHNEILARLGLHLTDGLGPAAALRLLETFGSASAAIESGPGELAHRGRLKPETARRTTDCLDRAEAEIEALERLGGGFTALGQSGYPEWLAALPDPPLVFFHLGRWLPEDGRALAIVGSRKATEYGRLTSFRLAGELAALGITVVSGLAVGIDSQAHKGALNAAGRTIAVTGCGLDIPYPRPNVGLKARIAGGGGAVISEYPLGTEPAAWRFPVRNRIIAGLSQGVIVAEASPRSGSLITARLAAEYGRTVMAVPGPVNEQRRVGTHRLIREGAVLVTTGAEAAVEIWPEVELKSTLLDTPGRSEIISDLDGPPKRIYRLLETTPRHVDDIIRESGLAAAEALGILLDLELKGLTVRLAGQMYVRK